MGDTTINVGASTDKAQQEFQKLSKRVEELGEAAKGIATKAGLAFAGISGVIAASVAEYAESERATNALNQALKTQGIFSKELAGRYEELAGSIQKKTAFGDDDVTQGLAAITAYTGQLEITEELTGAVADFAAAQGIDLASAFQLVGKSIGTNTNALARYGIEIDEGATAQEKMAVVTGALSEKFRGQAEAQAQGLGALSQMKNAFGELAEVLGKQFAPIVSKAAAFVTSLLNTIQENEGLVKFGAFALAAGAAVTGLVASVATLTVGIGYATTAFATFNAVVLANPITAALGAIALAAAALFAAWQLNFLGIQEITAGVFGAVKGFIKDFVSNSSKALLGFGSVLQGVFTLDYDKITKGIDDINDAFKDQVDSTIKGYQKAHDAKIKQLDKDGAATKTALTEDVDAHGNAAKRKVKLSKDQIEAIKEAEKKAKEDRDKAIDIRFKREEKVFDTEISRIGEKRIREQESFTEIRKAEEEQVSLAEKQFQLKLDYIDTQKFSELERIQRIKDAEQELADKKVEIEEGAQDRIGQIIEAARKQREKEAEDQKNGSGSVMGAVGDTFSAIVAFIKGTVDALVTTGQEIKNFFGGNFINSIAGFVEDLLMIPSMFVKSFVDFDEIMKKLPKELYKASRDIIQVIPQIVARFVKEFPKLVNTFVAAFPKITKTIIDALPKILKAITDALPKITEAIVAAFPALIRLIPELVQQLFRAIPLIMTEILEELPEIITAIFEVIPQIVRAFIDAVPDIVTALAENADEIALALVEGIVASAGEIIAALVESLLVEGGLEQIVGALIRAMPRVAVALVQGLFRGLESAVVSIGQVFGKGLSLGLSSIGQGAGEFGAKIMKGFVGAIDAFISKVQNIGFQVFNGFLKAIQNYNVANFGKQIFDGFRKAFERAALSIGIGGGGGGVGGTLKGAATGPIGVVTSAIGFSAHGGPVRPRYAAAGLSVPRGSDTIPVMTQEDEFIVNARSARANDGLIRRINNSSTPLEGGSQEIVLRIVGDDDFGRMVEKSIVRGSTLGTSRLRVAVGSED